MKPPTNVLFTSDLWQRALERYASDTHLSVKLFDAGERIVFGPVNPTPLFQLFEERGYEPGIFAECARRCLAQTNGRPAVIVSKFYGLTVVGTSLVLNGETVGAAVGGYALVDFSQVSEIQRLAKDAGIKFERIWEVARAQKPVPQHRLMLNGELLQVLGDALLRENHRTRQYEDAVRKLEETAKEKDAANQELGLQQERLAAELAATQQLQKISLELIREGKTETLYGRIMDAAVEIMRSDFASMQMLYPERGTAGELRLLAFHGFDAAAAKFWEWVRADSNCSCGAALRTSQRVVVPDVENCDFMAGTDDQVAYFQAGIHAMQSTPLVSRAGHLLGMISTHWRKSHTPSEQDLRQFDILARQAADLIERNQAEEALSESELRYRNLFESMDEGYCIIEMIFDRPGAEQAVDYRFIEVNPAFEAQAGMRDATGKRMLEFVPSIEEHWLANYTKVALTGQPLRFANEYKTLNRWFDVYAFRVGQPEDHRIAVLFTDITARKRAELALREAGERFRFMAESMPQKMFTATAKGDVDYFNPQWMEFTGLSYEQIKDWGWTQFIHPEDVEENVRRWGHALATGEPFYFEHRFRRADGGYHWHFSRALPMRDARGDIVMWIGSSADIQPIKDQEERLRKTEKMAAAGQLAASMAHEINNPLSSVTNSLYLLETHANLDESARLFVTTAATELARVSRIVKQSLSYYRVGSTPRDLDLGEIVNGSLRIFSEKIQKASIELKPNIRKGAMLLGFPDEIRQVIDNLLYNALEAMPGGGRLCISVHDSFDWKDRHEPRKGVRLTIADTGCGIPKEHRWRIFEPFFTTKEEKGTGLGLWILQGIIAKHDGVMSVRSSDVEHKSGTVFSIFLPSDARRVDKAKISEAESAA